MNNKLFSALLVAMVCGLLSGPAMSEIVPGTSLNVDFHAGHVIGSGRNINMLRVPVTDIDTGQTTLYDASFKFTFLPNQGFVFEEISSVALSQPVQTIASIRTGLYRTQGGICYLLEGPTILNDSRSLYTIRGIGPGGSGCSNALDNFTAQIVSGPAAGHPDIGDRDIVPNLTANWSYGFVSGRASFSTPTINFNWLQNNLFGIRQSGEQLIVGLFSEGSADFKDPRETAILTRIPE
ncbi:MAG: hypothetical protein WAT53_06020 [Nitrosomonas sp.]|nr:hypothetical protein [Nitrosomonas sp.]MCC7135444.1 hypothetical protein [Nitrosomonas sp.]